MDIIDNILILRGEDLCPASRAYAIETINLSDFNHKDIIEQQSMVVFVDTDGSKSVLKDRTGVSDLWNLKKFKKFIFGR